MHRGSLRSGELVAGRYQVLRVLGDGGYGTVYEAQAGAHRVAIKVMHERLGRGSVPAQRFQREIELVRRLNHPGIVRCLDGGVDETGIPFIVFELLQGRTLREELDARGALDPGQATQVTRQVLEALVHAHAMGVVHRDLKPANIFLGLEDAAGRPAVKVLDFGVARSMHGDVGTPNLTVTGQMVGTPHYMSPEQVRGQPADHRADLYTSGVVFAEMLTGSKLLSATTEMDLLLIHADDGPIPIPLPLQASPFRAVIERAVAKNPDARYPDAAHMLADLDAAAAAAGGSSGDWTISTHRTSLLAAPSYPPPGSGNPYHHPSAPPPPAQVSSHPAYSHPSAGHPSAPPPYAAVTGGISPTVSDPALAASAGVVAGRARPKWPWVVAGAGMMAVLSLGTAAVVIGLSRTTTSTASYNSDSELAAAHDAWMKAMEKRRTKAGYTVGEERRIVTSGMMASSFLMLQRSSAEIVSLSIATYPNVEAAERAAGMSATSSGSGGLVILDETTVVVGGGSVSQGELRGLVPVGKVVGSP